MVPFQSQEHLDDLTFISIEKILENSHTNSANI